MSETKVPATAKKPTDHQPKKNEADAANAEPIKFVYGDETYEIAADAFDDIEVLEAMEDENFIVGVRQILGREQWSKFKESARDAKTGRVSLTGSQEFLTGLMEAAGQGN